MARNLRRSIISKITEITSNTSRQNLSSKAITIKSLNLKYNKSSNGVEYHLPIRNGQINENLIKIDGIDCISKMTDKIGNNLVFTINKSKFMKHVLNTISENPRTFLQNCEMTESIGGKKILIEFSSPNIAKPFHMGHLRSTIQGNFLSNLNSSLGQNVVKINYLGDWGTQFGFLHVGLELNKVTDEQISVNPIQTLYEAYVAAHARAESDPSVAERAREIFSQLEEGRFAELERWHKFREYTVRELEVTYGRLGVTFDEYQWESMFGAREIQDVLQCLTSRGILIAGQDGKQVAEVGVDRQVTLVKSDGSTLYLTRDLAAARYRYCKHQFDRLLYVVDSGQSDHFTAMKFLLDKMGHDWSRHITHVKFGRVHGMSTRHGNVVFLRDILDEARVRVLSKQQQTATTRADQSEDTADVLAVSAVVVNDLKQRRQRDYHFDWDKALQMQGDGGIKLQYTHCRLTSLQEKSSVVCARECQPELLVEPEACALITELARFEQVLVKCHEEMEACILVNYLFSLSSLVNAAFKRLTVKGQQTEVAQQRLLMFSCARIVIQQGLNILGLRALDRM